MSTNQSVGDFDDSALDALFAQARAEPPADLSDDFTARLVAASLEVQAGFAPPKPGWLARLRNSLAEIGGAPSLAGVGAAGLAGVWIGFAAPGSTGDLVNSVLQGAASVSPASSVWIGSASNVLTTSDSDLLALIDGDIE